MSAPAAAIIRSSRSPFRLHQRPDGGFWFGPGRSTGASARRWPAACRTCAGIDDASGVHVTFAIEAGMPLRWANLVSLQRTDQQFHWAERRLRHVRRFSRRAVIAQAQDHPPRAARRAGKRHQRALADWQRSDRRRLGCFLRRSTWRPVAQMGPPLPDPEFYSLVGETMARPHPPGHGQARRPLDRRRHQFHRFAYPVRTPLGRRSSTIRFCISNCATIRPSTTRSPTSFRLSKPARRASTKSRAAICRGPLFRRITSPIRRCAGPSPITWCASAPTWRPSAQSLPPRRLIAKIW